LPAVYDISTTDFDSYVSGLPRYEVRVCAMSGTAVFVLSLSALNA
jgi:hypothetical protein